VGRHPLGINARWKTYSCYFGPLLLLRDDRGRYVAGNTAGQERFMIDSGLKDKIVLITGANNPHGIGAAVGRAFAAQGSKVFLHFFRRTDKPAQPDAGHEASSPDDSFYYSQQTKTADEVVAEIRTIGVQAHAWESDFSDSDSISPLFDRAEHLLGPVEVLVNNAAHWEADTFVPSGAELSNRLVELWSDRPGGITAGSFDRLFGVNTRAAALLMGEFARRHIRRAATWGRIINVSTGAEKFPSEVSYGASKYALESYTRSAAVELGRFGITVNVVSLGPVQTGWITPELEREILPTIPLGKIGNPKDVADVVVFLASNQARWVAGQKIYVGGGHGM
jgi:3-oxoacyl-[acyl-carrier protein] reductase